MQTPCQRALRQLILHVALDLVRYGLLGGSYSVRRRRVRAAAGSSTHREASSYGFFSRRPLPPLVGVVLSPPTRELCPVLRGGLHVRPRGAAVPRAALLRLLVVLRMPEYIRLYYLIANCINHIIVYHYLYYSK